MIILQRLLILGVLAAGVVGTCVVLGGIALVIMKAIDILLDAFL